METNGAGVGTMDPVEVTERDAAIQPRPSAMPADNRIAGQIRQGDVLLNPIAPNHATWQRLPSGPDGLALMESKEGEDAGTHFVRPGSAHVEFLYQAHDRVAGRPVLATVVVVSGGIAMLDHAKPHDPTPHPTIPVFPGTYAVHRQRRFAGLRMAPLPRID